MKPFSDHGHRIKFQNILFISFSIRKQGYKNKITEFLTFGSWKTNTKFLMLCMTNNDIVISVFPHSGDRSIYVQDLTLLHAYIFNKSFDWLKISRLYDTTKIWKN